MSPVVYDVCQSLRVLVTLRQNGKASEGFDETFEKPESSEVIELADHMQFLSRVSDAFQLHGDRSSFKATHRNTWPGRQVN